MSCQVAHVEIAGWRAIRLTNSFIEVTVLPEKGADIYSFVDLASGVDVLMKTPWGLLPADAAPRPGSSRSKFLHNYEGAWQELFPNTGPACVVDGREIPMHGEVATLPWDLRIECESAHEVQIRLDVKCSEGSVALTRRMRLSRAAPVLMIDEAVRNLSDARVLFVWGHHPVLGAPFLEAGCRASVDQCTVHTPAVSFDPENFSYALGQRATWPYVRRVDGQEVDLRVVPGPDANTHDHACLTDLEQGWIEVENPRLGLAFSLEWDPSIFRWINNWRPLGGSHSAPLEGIYGFAIEPWATQSNLGAAIASAEALALEAGDKLTTSLRATLRHT